MIPTNTWKQPPLSPKAKQDIKQSQTPQETRQQIEYNDQNTWISPNGQIRRQVDYVLVNQRYRNTATRAVEKQGWVGNTAKRRQRAVIKMDIALRISRGYYEKYQEKQERK